MAKFKVLGSIMFVFSLMSCGPSNTTSDKLLSISEDKYLNDGVFSSSIVEIVELNDASKKVAIKPMAEVREYNGCTEIHKFRYRSIFGEEVVLITARNDAVSFAANAISILDFDTDKDKHVYTIGLYKCA
jgi:hypothetical protein